METALLKYSLADVIQKLRGILVKQGFLIENFDVRNQVVIAYRDGNWYRSPKYILFELSSMDNRGTRIDITASIDSRRKNRKAEEVAEEKIVSMIYNSF